MDISRTLVIRIVVVFFLAFGIAPSLHAFQTASEILSLGDSILGTSEDSVSKDTGQQVDTLKKRRTINMVIQSLEKYVLAANHLNKIMERKVDTVQMSDELPVIERRIAVVKGRLEHKDRDINLRYLSAIRNFITYQTRQVAGWKKEIDVRSEEVANAHDSLQVIKSDKMLQFSVDDPDVLPDFQEQLKALQKRIDKGDSLYIAQQYTLAKYQSRLSNVLIEVEDFKEDIEEQERIIERQLFRKEINYVWEKRGYRDSKKLWEVIQHSLDVNVLILNGYGEVNGPTHFFIGFLVLLFYLWFYYLLRHIKAEKEFSDIILQRTKFIPKYPLLSALLIVLPFASFFYHSPPVVLVVGILWLLMMVTTVLIKSTVKRKVYIYWWIFLGMFVVYSMSNLYIETAYEERWPLLVLSFVSIGLAVNAISAVKRSDITHMRYIMALIQLFLLIQGLSALANIMGRYSLAKILGIAATTSLLQAVGLYVFVLVIMEAIYLQIERSKKSSTEYTAYFDFQDIQARVRKVFVFLATAIWVYYLTVNLTIYDYLYAVVTEFLDKERMIGQTTFDFGGVFTFVAILWISGIISKYISYFAEAKDQKMAANRKQRLGSSILLIKLAVFTIGFLLAVTAAGIPLDNVAIVLGALSVGIGFGLQTIINNLVSGIILAFERPIQIGDAIEVAGQSGVVKEVGIRASKIQAYDGSEIVMPNGDLLSQQLVNWTLSNKRKRVELIIGVAYGSDTEKVEGILYSVIDREGIMKNPAPSVFLQNFADSAVEYRVLFWVNDFDNWVGMRNEVMKDVYKVFAKEGVEIPFPQRDLNIRNIPESWKGKGPVEVPKIAPEEEEGGNDAPEEQK